VQAFPSSQENVLFVCVHPVAGAQASSVQTLLSLQFGAAPPTHVPPEHLSVVVQAFPSSQEAVLFACVQPVAGEHESFVQTLLSLQFGAAPPTQVPPAQVSPVVQAFPSSQAMPLLACAQPVAGTQESVVQELPSSQFGAAPPTQVPVALQASAVVQALPSVHPLPAGSCAVQFFPASLQLSEQFPSPSGPGQGLPVWTLQAPAEQVSVPLQ
jgi:hypothetical protein